MNIRNSRLYSIWGHMKQRCNNPKSHNFKYYGGRGIKVCEEWSNSFEAFYGWANSNGYADDLEIDRVEGTGNYEPSNCRWVTPEENRRRRWHK